MSELLNKQQKESLKKPRKLLGHKKYAMKMKETKKNDASIKILLMEEGVYRVHVENVKNLKSMI